MESRTLVDQTSKGGGNELQYMKIKDAEEKGIIRRTSCPSVTRVTEIQTRKS